jgi:UDP-glucose 4-epimerase
LLNLLVVAHPDDEILGFAHDSRNADKIADLYYKVNVDATVQLANLAVKSGVKRFVFVSSVKAGGGGIPNRCINEDGQNKPERVYGKTKREAELKLLEIGTYMFQLFAPHWFTAQM